MRKAAILICCILILSFAFSGCGGKKTAEDTAQTAEIIETEKVTVTPEPIPTPTPEPIIEFNGEKLRESELKDGYSFELFGQEVNTATTERLEYLRTEIGDDGLEKIREVLPYMYGLKYLSFDRCGTSDEAVAKLREDFPDVKIAWRIYFGPFSCMTDVEKIWASCDLYDSMTEPLKYCNDVKYLDVGHGPLKDYNFLKYMPNLEVLIISCGDVEDVTPIGKYCHNLIFLEAAETRIKDLSPIAKCTTLEYLNVGGNQNMDPSTLPALYTLPNLKRFYCENFYGSGIIMDDEGEKVKKLMPNCEVDFGWNGDTALNDEWRYTRGLYNGHYTDMYLWIRGIFEYDNPYGSTRLYD